MSPDEQPFTAAELARTYPRLYHMAEAGKWSSIRRHGLLSTNALLDLFEVAGPERERIESQRRAHSVTIRHPKHGSSVICDQKPMTNRALQKCLVDCTPNEWYEILNRRVFFWLSRDRLVRLLSARSYRDKRQTVLTVDTERLLSRYARQVTLSPINSGATLFKPPPRGTDTFRRISDYPFEDWRRQRGLKDAIVELAVDGQVLEIEDLVVKVEHMKNGGSTEVIWTDSSDS